MLRSHDIDICIVTETWLKEKTIHDTLYNAYICNRVSKRAEGVAIFIKKNIEIKVVFLRKRYHKV